MPFRQTLASRIADPLLWRVIKRYPLHRRLAEFRVRQWDDVGTFEQRQREALGALLAHALSRVPYYSENAPDLSSYDLRRDAHECLTRFPVLERDHLIRNFTALTSEMGRGTYETSSGGSTGEPVGFLHDRVYNSAALATTVLFFEWAGVERGARLVKLWGAPRDLGGSVIPARRRLADWLANRTTLDAFDMSEAAMAEYATRIADIRPVCVEGYADALHELAVHAQLSGVAFTGVSAVVSSAGTLLPHMRDAIGAAFGAPVFDRYGTREVGNVAAECEEHDGLHVFGETTVLEIVDDLGRRVAEGEEGDVLVTNLTNYTMPFIRYRIGDRAVWRGGQCDCGRPYPLLARVVGRSNSRVLRSDGGSVPAEFFIHVLGVEYNDGSIRKFQVVQKSLDEILIRVVLRDAPTASTLAHEDDIRRRIRQMIGNDCRVRFQFVDNIEPTQTGKQLQVIGLGTRPNAKSS